MPAVVLTGTKRTVTPGASCCSDWHQTYSHSRCHLFFLTLAPNVQSLLVFLTLAPNVQSLLVPAVILTLAPNVQSLLVPAVSLAPNIQSLLVPAFFLTLAPNVQSLLVPAVVLTGTKRTVTPGASCCSDWHQTYSHSRCHLFFLPWHQTYSHSRCHLFFFTLAANVQSLLVPAVVLTGTKHTVTPGVSDSGIKRSHSWYF